MDETQNVRGIAFSELYVNALSRYRLTFESLGGICADQMGYSRQ